MSFLEACATALNMVLRNTLRSALAMVGIVISVMAVVCTVAVGDGAQMRLANDMASLGQGLMFVASVSSQVAGVRAGAGSGTAVTLADVDAIGRELPHLVRYVAPMVRVQGQVVYGHSNWGTTLVGTTHAFFLARGWAFAQGMAFTPDDEALAAKRCVLGANVNEQLFGTSSSLSQVVRVNGMMCVVTGVLAPKGASGFGPDQDDMLFMPIATLHRRIAPIKENRGVTAVVQAKDASMSAFAEDEVARLMRQRHRLGPDAQDDFSVFNLSELQKSAERQAQTVALLLSSVAAISLLVGAIGIANVMLVAVTERTKEIGLRMAVGARRQDILLQFLLEAAVLSLIGAMVGLTLGWGVAFGLRKLTAWPIALQGRAALWAVASALAAGMGAGLVPALRASRLDPISALRYD